MFSELHLLHKGHFVPGLPAQRVPWKLLVLSWSKWKGMRVTAHSKVSRMTPAPLTKWAFWLTSTSGQYCHFMRWAVGRQMPPNHINWNLLSQDSSISISLWMLVCATWYLAGVGISSLIAYILNLLSLSIFVLQSNYGWKSVCNMRSSIFSLFHFRQILPRKKKKFKKETELRNPDLLLYFDPLIVQMFTC